MQYICNFIKHKCSLEAITFIGLNSPLSPGLENLPTAIFFKSRRDYYIVRKRNPNPIKYNQFNKQYNLAEITF